MANKPPQTLKRPIPKHLIERLGGLAQQQAAIEQQRTQLLQDFAGFLGVDPQRFGLWFNDDENPPTYEVLTKVDFERRQRLRAAVAQAQATPPADPTPKPGEKPLPIADKAG